MSAAATETLVWIGLRDSEKEDYLKKSQAKTRQDKSQAEWPNTFNDHRLDEDEDEDYERICSPLVFVIIVITMYLNCSRSKK